MREVSWQYGNARTAALKKREDASQGNVTAELKTASKRKNNTASIRLY